MSGVSQSTSDARRAPPDILYFGNDWFTENRTSSHHIARRLAKLHRVYYLECPGLRAPRGEERDLAKVGSTLLRFLRGPVPVLDGLKVRTLLQLPLHRYALVRWANRAFITLTVKWLMWREGIKAPIAWFLVPHVAPVVGRLGESLSVYYCTDDYASFPNVDAPAVRALDQELTRRADLVFVTSESLLEAKLKLNPETHVSPHGVDLEHFGSALDNQEPPADVRSLPRPVVGFFGLIERWIDLDLVAYLASQRPSWSFVMVGRVALPASDVPKLPNLHYIGRRPYEQLPAYGRVFDVAIIPYRLTPQVLHANPLKLREYLAMGRPVVAVSTPEIERYADVVAIARSRDEFLSKLDAVLASGFLAASAEQRRLRVSGEGWDARVHAVMEIVAGRLPRRSR
jgi:glycosyltransferase involved in cell wall biosynthesis